MSPPLPFTPYPSVDQLQRSAAHDVAELIRRRCAEAGKCVISLSGGSTPKRMYELLAESDLPWDRLHLFWGDERNVPHDHADSNYRMVREAWLNQVAVPQSNVHPVPVDVGDPATAAKQYDREIRQHFGGELPSWDLVLLGMGDDAHTASLFPQTAAITETQKYFVENWVPKFDAHRYTLTAPAINSGQEIWFLIAGQNKREALANVLGQVSNLQEFPSQLIQPTRWYVTADAV